jgi:hypothetical protein
MSRIIILLILILYAANIKGQQGARSAALGHNNVALSDVYALFNNPAATTNVHRSALVSGWENRFSVSKLSRNIAGAVIKTNSGAAGMHIFHTGFSAYSESNGGLFYAHQLSEHFSAAVQLNLLHTHIPEYYGSMVSVSADASLHYTIDENLSLGFHTTNILQSKRRNDPDPLAQIIQLGILCQFSEKLLMTSDIIKDMALPVSFGIGLEWSALNALFLRTGMRHKPQLNSFGAGYRIAGFMVDLSFSYAPILGMTPSISVVYEL